LPAPQLPLQQVAPPAQDWNEQLALLTSTQVKLRHMLPQQSPSLLQLPPKRRRQVLHWPWVRPVKMLHMPVQQADPLVQLPSVAVQVETHWPPLHVALEPQTLQLAPPVPHAELEVPARQLPFWQQPLGQLSELHTQDPSEQVWPAAHWVHAVPAVPHAEGELPLTQVVPWQQPLGQLEALHPQAPPEQAWPEPHTAQALPEAPHALVEMPG